MLTYHYNFIQGTEEWRAARCGLLTASEMKYIVTPSKLQYASNDKERSHLYELLSQRITKYVEPRYICDDILRGQADEIDAKDVYEKNYAKITDCGFITNDKFGFTLGYSPDALVGDEGSIEVKSRRQKFQVETILEGAMPAEYSIQIQTGLLVSERKWCDFISYCGGLPMLTLRITPDEIVQKAIVMCAREFYDRMDMKMELYAERLMDCNLRFTDTERRPPEQDIRL